MEYRRHGNKIVLRLDCGDEIVESLAALAVKEKIDCASVSGIGATDSLAVGIYDLKAKRYVPVERSGDHEITSIAGNITDNGGKPRVHIHLIAAGTDGVTVSGHLVRAVISATGELFVDVVDAHVGRKPDSRTGLSFMDFD